MVEELVSAKAQPVAPPTVPVGLPSDLVRRRPDVRRAERELAAATARIGVAVADLYPRFSLTARVGSSALEAEELFKGKGGLWSLGPSLDWPIFTAGIATVLLSWRAAAARGIMVFSDSPLIAQESNACAFPS